MKKLLSLLAISTIAVSSVSCDSEPETFTDIYGRTFYVTEFTQLDPLEDDETYAVIETSKGDITVKFLPDEAPLAVENFITHAENGYYDGLTFHRIIDDFMIQGGDPLGTGAGGESIWGEPFVNEYSINARHFAGALAMANSGPDTNGSQFYIVENSTVDDATKEMLNEMKNNLDTVLDTDDEGNELKVSDYFTEEIIDAYIERGGTAFLDFGYTVFGQVVEGFEVVEEIAETEMMIAEIEVGADADSNEVHTHEIEVPVEDVIIETITIYNN